MRIYFNPLDAACKSVCGACKRNEKITFRLFHLKDLPSTERYNAKNGGFCRETPSLEECVEPIQNAYFLLNKDGETVDSFPMQKTAFGWQITISLSERGLYYYHFSVEEEGNIFCGALELGALGNATDGFLLTIYDESYHTPDWFKGGVMYQIFPDRFYKKGTMPDIKGRIRRDDWGGLPSYKPNEKGKVLNNDFFGGNLRGITEKLSYLEALGVTTIYCNPIFEAASNHRYDTSDYEQIDPFLGTEEDFSELVESAKAKGIRIILDGVFNHTGDNSLYFNKYGEYPSLGAYQSKDSPYYSWYSFQTFPDKYDSWWGIDVLPEVNESSESYQKFLFEEGGVLKKWLRFGIGGYRLDVADELPDFFLQKLRRSVKEENDDALIIGEVWEDASNKIAYSKRREYLQGFELDSVMNYPWKEAIIRYIQTGNALELLHSVRVILNHYPKQTVDCLMNILGTHDTARILTVLGGIYCRNKDEMASDAAFLSEEAKQNAIEKLKTAVVLQYTLPGVPCVYYGDENGMEGHIDPFCRRCFDWGNQNENLMSFYAQMGALRKRYKKTFKDGAFVELACQDGLLFYKRTGETDVYVCVNHSPKGFLLKLSESYIDCLTNERYENRLNIPPFAYKIFVKANER